MNPNALFVVTSDPRTSPRPAEAVRIAAGIAVWKRVGVTVYLRHRAVLALGEFSDELVDGENFSRYLPLVPESGGLICTQRDAAALGEIGQSPIPFREIGDDELARQAAQADYVIRF
jgi:hypothetical protein